MRLDVFICPGREPCLPVGIPAAACRPEGRLAELGRRAREGDHEALDALLGKLHGPVQRYLTARLSGVRDQDDVAGDLGQEVLIRAAGALPRCHFPDDRRLMAWVLMIARNALVDHLRAERGRREVGSPDGLEAAAEQAALARWRHGAPGERHGTVVQELAAAAAAELSEGARELLRLRFQLGYTWKQVAAVLHISESAAKRRFQRAQSTVRRRLLARLDALPPGQRERALRALGQPSSPPSPRAAAPAPWRTS